METMERKSKSIQKFIVIFECTKGETSPGLSPHVIYDSITPYVSFVPEANFVGHISPAFMLHLPLCMFS